MLEIHKGTGAGPRLREASDRTAEALRELCSEAVAAGIAGYLDGRSMPEEDPLVLGNDGERWEELLDDLYRGDDERMRLDGREEGRHGIYLCPEADGYRDIRFGEDHGGRAHTGWCVQPRGRPQEWESCFDEI